MKGLFCQKVGMMGYWTDTKCIAVTVLRIIDHCQLNQDMVLIKTKQRIKKPQEFLVKSIIEQTDEKTKLKGMFRQMEIDNFQINDFIDIQGTTKGKGFAGVVKRYGVPVRGRSCVSLAHRTIGSTGARITKVFKNQIMPGHMGVNKRTQQNLQIVNIEDGLIFVKGSIPGAKNSTVFVKKAIKKQGVINNE
jgi:large subunit ribosomal protein L3